MLGKANRVGKGWSYCMIMMEWRDYEQLRRNFGQIKMETREQVRMQVRNLLERAED